MLKTEQKIMEVLLEFFPEKRLQYNDFICDEIKCALYHNQKMIEKYFEFVSLPWTEISLEKLEKTYFDCENDFNGLVFLSRLSQKTFVHIFPSLLVTTAKEKNYISHIDYYFCNNHLDLRNVKKNWEKEFYFSLGEKVKKIIALILYMISHDALDSYWQQFRNTEKVEEIVLSASQIAPDLVLDGLDLRFRRIEAGRFMMGSNVDKRYYDMYGDVRYNLKYNDPFETEKVRHSVCITRPFYMGQYPVTQAQWLKVMEDNPSYFVRNDIHPVENISWDDTQAFIAKLNTEEVWCDDLEAYRRLKQLIACLNEKTGLNEKNGYAFRLPTEAEWEYACRAVSETDSERETKEYWRWFFGDDPSELEYYGWFEANAGITTHPVGGKRPNPWGLYDLYCSRRPKTDHVGRGIPAQN